MRFRQFSWVGLLAAALTHVANAEPPGVSNGAEVVPVTAPTGSPENALDLETALRWTLSSNPDLVVIRQNLGVSAAAMAVAERFPTSLNPTVSIDLRPWTFDHNTGQGSQPLATMFSVSWSQPIELGHRTEHRSAIARAAYTETQWNVLQAELQALVQTYRLHQTATYRREKLRVSQQLAEFNERLVQVSRRQVAAAQMASADLILAEVENQSMVQRLLAAQKDYLDALTELRKQIGLPQYAGSLIPTGELKIPEGFPYADEDSVVQSALKNDPEINAAEAQADGSAAALRLAEADRIPVFSAGPVYEHDESGTTFYGLVLSTPIPVLNAGRTLVNQREIEHARDVATVEQLRIRTAARAKAALVEWNQTRDLVGKVFASTDVIQVQADRMDRLYAAGQTDVVKLLQVRQRLIEGQGARVDAVWQSTQAYADLIAAIGTTTLMASVRPENVPHIQSAP